jgi:hypothetical protein
MLSAGHYSPDWPRVPTCSPNGGNPPSEPNIRTPATQSDTKNERNQLTNRFMADPSRSIVSDR